MSGPMILGHRGAPLEAVENSLAGFVRAIELGAHGIECDLRRLRDGSIVLFHDGTAGGEIVENLDRAGLEAIVGPVADASVLSSLPASALLDLEVKKSGWEEELVELVRSLPNAFVSSFDHEVLVRMRRLGWDGDLGALLEEPARFDRSHPGVRASRYLLPRSARVSGDDVVGWIEEGFEVIPWTVNDIGRARQLAGWGCRGIITDLPGLMVAGLSAEASDL